MEIVEKISIVKKEKNVSFNIQSKGHFILDIKLKVATAVGVVFVCISCEKMCRSSETRH